MEISSTELLNWRKHPCSEKFFQYLADFRQHNADTIRNILLNGNEPDNETVKLVAMRCEVISDILDIEFEDIDRFYNPDKYNLETGERDGSEESIGNNTEALSDSV